MSLASCHCSTPRLVRAAYKCWASAAPASGSSSLSYLIGQARAGHQQLFLRNLAPGAPVEEVALRAAVALPEWALQVNRRGEPADDDCQRREQGQDHRPPRMGAADLGGLRLLRLAAVAGAEPLR